MTESTFVMTK